MSVEAFDRIYNFRDIGGHRTADGRLLKTGLFYRSDDPSRATASDRLKLRELKLKLICDLRSPEEMSRPPLPGVRVVNIPLHDHAIHDFSHWTGFSFLLRKDGGDRFLEFTRNYYRHIAFDRTQQIGEVLRLLATPGNQPALIHCRAGKDRTGLIAALIQLLAGVPYETVLQDYLQTNASIKPRVDTIIRVLRVFTMFQAKPERIRLLASVRAEDLDRTYRQVISEYGSTESYLSNACGIDMANLARFKHSLIGLDGRTF